MPTRFWIPVDGVDPGRVRLEHVHAAVSRWFDRTEEEHRDNVKPFALSPVSSRGDGTHDVGIEVAALTDDAHERLDAGVATGRIRLGSVTGSLGRPEPIHRESWAELDRWSGAQEWLLRFHTPVTFRQRDRSQPWPAPSAVLRGLSESWNRWSGLPERRLTYQQVDDVWVTEIDGHTETVIVGPMELTGFVGEIAFRTTPAQAALVDPLMRLATFSGVGTAKHKGLGVTSVHVDTCTVAR